MPGLGFVAIQTKAKKRGKVMSLLVLPIRIPPVLSINILSTGTIYCNSFYVLKCLLTIIWGKFNEEERRLLTRAQIPLVPTANTSQLVIK